MTPASAVQASIEVFTHEGIGTVRPRPCFPTRSTMHQRQSRCWTCFVVRFASSHRRNPRPRSVASMARSRSPFLVRTFGAFRSDCALEERQPPVPDAHARRFYALDPRDSRCQFRREQPVVGRLDRQLQNRRDPHVDRNRAELAGFERCAPGSNGRLRPSASNLDRHQQQYKAGQRGAGVKSRRSGSIRSDRRLAEVPARSPWPSVRLDSRDSGATMKYCRKSASSATLSS